MICLVMFMNGVRIGMVHTPAQPRLTLLDQHRVRTLSHVVVAIKAVPIPVAQPIVRHPIQGYTALFLASAWCSIKQKQIIQREGCVKKLDAAFTFFKV